MKRSLLTILILMLACLFLAGCGGSKKAEDASAGYSELISKKKEELEESGKREEEAEAADPDEEEPEEDVPEDDGKDAGEDSLLDVLAGETGIDDEPVLFYEDDFDGDGLEEAFALVGEENDDYDGMRVAEGSVYFVTKDGAAELFGPAAIAVYDVPRTMVMGDVTYVLFDQVFTTALVTHVWSVSGGDAVEAPFSAKGEVLTDTPGEEGRFAIMDDEYDCMYDQASDSWMGHSWKNYYFFYNSEDGEVQEYAGTEIDRENVIYLCGRDLVGDLVPKGARVDSLFCRGNGMIVINYAQTEDGCVNYSHIIYDFSDETFVDDFGMKCGEEPQGGICREALCPEIANYPQVPDGSDQF